jgi:DNA adenine methylase
MHEESAHFKPFKGIAPYLGGKSRLAKTIAAEIEKIPHQQYAEPFVGMGGMFFRRLTPAHYEVVNDINKEISNLYRILQRHYPAFVDYTTWMICSRDTFAKLKAANPESLTDLERAARFYYLQKICFGGRSASPTFPAHHFNPSRFNINRLTLELEQINQRLSGVVIECMDFGDFIARYDGANTLFYLDPPYYHHENDYGSGVFRRADFTRLASILSGITGKFILSLNDVPEVRQIFSAFGIRAVTTTYTTNGAHQKEVGEVLISNQWQKKSF